VAALKRDSSWAPWPKHGKGLRLANTRMHPTAAARWRTAAAGDARPLAADEEEQMVKAKTTNLAWFSILCAAIGLMSMYAQWATKAAWYFALTISMLMLSALAIHIDSRLRRIERKDAGALPGKHEESRR
jgi:hypothetical protein